MDRARYRGDLHYTTTNGKPGGKVKIHPSWIDEWLSIFMIVVRMLLVIAALSLAYHAGCRYSDAYCDLMRRLDCPLATD